MMNESRVKSVYPNAVMKWDWCPQPSKWDWSSDGSHSGEVYAQGVWVGDRCLAFGGRFEYKIWRRAWKQIEKDTLKKFAS